jgi:hypothetical protein
MAVAQPKQKPASKANATPKGKMQMHRRSRTGLSSFVLSIPVIFSFSSLLHDEFQPLLTRASYRLLHLQITTEEM